MALGTNRLPHPPVTLDIELLDKPIQAALDASKNWGAVYFVGKNNWYQIIYAFSYSRRAESSWLLNHVLLGLVNQAPHGLITLKGPSKMTLCSYKNPSASH